MELYAVSVDPPEASRRLKERLGLPMTFLADTEAVLLDELGILHRDAPGERGDIAYPTSILVDEDGMIRWIFASDTYRERAQPEDVFAEIVALD